MLEFYKKALLGLIGLLVISFVIAYLCAQQTFLHLALLPAGESTLTWEAEPSSDAIQGGLSNVQVQDDEFSLSFDFTISDKVRYPFATVAIVFKDQAGEYTNVNLSRYDAISFSAKCSPDNILSFLVFTFDENITKPDDLLTFKTPSTFFSCDGNWTRIELDLTRLETPQWWFDMFNLELSRQEYQLDKVPRIAFSSSFQSPKEVFAEVRLDELTLNGRDWRYMYVLGGCLFVLWSGYGFWFFRQHTRALTRDLKEKVQKDRSLAAYQRVSIEPKRDKERSTILRYIATEYANADLSLDNMVSEINVTRTKINEVLKAELGYTFISYLNKLRLTEAARLLTEQEEANIAEIAYSVGYKNVSYFNKLFKEEYGCTPKTFRSICNQGLNADTVHPSASLDN